VFLTAFKTSYSSPPTYKCFFYVGFEVHVEERSHVPSGPADRVGAAAPAAAAAEPGAAVGVRRHAGRQQPQAVVRLPAPAQLPAVRLDRHAVRQLVPAPPASAAESVRPAGRSGRPDRARRQQSGFRHGERSIFRRLLQGFCVHWVNG